MSNLPKFYLFKRNNGIYYVGYFENGRKRWKSTGATLKADALKAVSNLEELLKDKLQEVTLSKFKADFITFAEGNFSGVTVDFYRTALERLLSMTGDCPLSALTMQHVDNYKVNRLGSGRSLRGDGQQRVAGFTCCNEYGCELEAVGAQPICRAATGEHNGEAAGVLHQTGL